MSRQSRSSKSNLHEHCEKCYSRRCRKRVEVAVACAVIPCRLHCGALFHLCKEEEHLLLCPNVRVPCLNADYGCTTQMPRCVQAAHLEVCPASLVCCSMEWNRWPAEDAHAHPVVELHENLLKDGGAEAESLDLAMALRDQAHLFQLLKMKKLFPELIEKASGREWEEEKRAEEKRRKAIAEKKRADLEREQTTRRNLIWKPMDWVSLGVTNDAEDEDETKEEWEAEPEPELTKEEREFIATSRMVAPEVLASYNAWEKMFSMEMGGCREAGAGAAKGQEGGKCKGTGLDTLVEEDSDAGASASASNACMNGQQQAKSTCVPDSNCLPKYGKKKFEYGHVEPMKITTVRTFKIPSSFKARQGRIRNPGFYKKESIAVDTSDLGVGLDEMPIWEEVQASLLCSLEKELRGHLIAESTSSDTLIQDQGTQTYNFLSAPFRSDTSLADLTVDRPLELRLQLQVESVTSRHHKASSTFTFLCGHTFQRREFGKHFRNVHCDIQTCVNGWFQQRCPLAYLGCTYSQGRFQPSTQKATITYNQELSSYSLRPTIPPSLGEGSQPPKSSAGLPDTQRRRRGRAGPGGGGGGDSLSDLPYEVLCNIASFLDSMSLSQLALVSRLMREVCSSLLPERGMVSLHWEKKTYSHGKSRWKATHRVWQFSTLFSPVDKWCFRNAPPMSEHLKVCPYYEREAQTERIRLPSLRAETNSHCNGTSLVNMLHKKTIM